MNLLKSKGAKGLACLRFNIEQQAEMRWLRIMKQYHSEFPLREFVYPKCVILHLWLNKKSRVKGDFQARFCGNVGVKLPCVTRLATISKTENEDKF